VIFALLYIVVFKYEGELKLRKARLGMPAVAEGGIIPPRSKAAWTSALWLDAYEAWYFGAGLNAV